MEEKKIEIIYKDGELLFKKNRFNDGVMTEVPVNVPNLKVARFTLNESGNRAYATPEKFVFNKTTGLKDTFKK